MGLLDSMFGGGTAVGLVLDNTTTSPGSIVGGHVTLAGGKEPLRLTELAVRLMLVETTTDDESPLPNIELREVAKQVVAAGTPIAPGSQQTFAFRLTLPSDLPATSREVSFRVAAVADIPGVKDPS